MTMAVMAASLASHPDFLKPASQLHDSLVIISLSEAARQLLLDKFQTFMQQNMLLHQEHQRP